MKVANLGDFNLLNGVKAVGATCLGWGLSDFVSPTGFKNSIQKAEAFRENIGKIVGGSIAVILGTSFSVTINDFPAMVRPLLLRNLQVILSCGGSGGLVLGINHVLAGNIRLGIAEIAAGAAALDARLRA